MSLRDQLPRIIACDPRFPVDAYAFVLEALDHARTPEAQRPRAWATRPGPARPCPGRPSAKRPAAAPAGHVTGRELCHSVRKLALGQYGLLAAAVLGHWGIRSTSDIGDIVYNMIATGDLEKTPSDSRSDFNNVYDFATAPAAQAGPGATTSPPERGTSRHRPALPTRRPSRYPAKGGSTVKPISARRRFAAALARLPRLGGRARRDGRHVFDASARAAR